MIKHSLAFAIWPLLVHCFGYRRATIAMLLSAFVFLLTLLPFADTGRAGIINNVLLYRSMAGTFDLQPFLPQRVISLLMAAAVFATPALTRR